MNQCEKMRAEITDLMAGVWDLIPASVTDTDGSDAYQELKECRRHLVEARKCLCAVELYSKD